MTQLSIYSADPEDRKQVVRLARQALLTTDSPHQERSVCIFIHSLINSCFSR